MSPTEDLSDVAAAGREVLWKILKRIPTSRSEAEKYGRELVREALGQGGWFDYQRRRNPDDASGYLQLRQFRDVSNFNVGLFMQQIGYYSLPEVLKIAGEYAKEHSSNYMPGEPYGLDPRAKRWIESGYAVGESGIFNKPFHLNGELNP